MYKFVVKIKTIIIGNHIFDLTGTSWMNWCMLGAVVVCIPILCLFKERYSRLDIDTRHNGQPLNGGDQDDVHDIQSDSIAPNSFQT